MTKVAVWCRHEGDNIIGIGKEIPWRVPSDFKRFSRIVAGENIVVGRTTYETLPPKYDNESIFILTHDADYETRNSEKHKIVEKAKFFKDFEEDIYISGGAGIYNLFMMAGNSLLPDIVVDCVYHGKMLPLEGEKADISESVKVLEDKFRQIGSVYEEDDVTVALYVKKDEFIEQRVLNKLINAISLT